MNNVPKGTSSQTTQKGPWGGGNKYGQMPTQGGGFNTVKPIKGHTQQSNLKYQKPGPGK